MYGTFLFGAPGSTREKDTKTLLLLKRLLAEELISDFQSSICVPQPGTLFYRWADQKGYLLTKDWSKYNGYRAVVSYPHYSKEEIEDVFQECASIAASMLAMRIGEIPSLVGRRLKRYGLPRTARELLKVLRSRLQ